MIKKIFSLFLVTIAFVGCASLGEPYKKPESLKKDQALVIIYRSSAFVGFAASFDVKANDKVITTLKNGGYFAYETKPGKLKLATDTLENKSEVELDLKPGQIAYVKGTIKPGALAARAEIQLVGDEFGAEEASKCKEILP